jgi:hypothetical protein
MDFGRQVRPVSKSPCVEYYAKSLSSPADCTSLDIEIRGTSHSQQKGFQLHSVHLNTSDIVAKADDKQRM